MFFGYNRYRSFGGGRDRLAFCLFFIFGMIVMVGIHLSDARKKRKQEIRKIELSAQGRAEMFWKALLKNQWPRAQSLLSEKNVLKVFEYARQNGEEGVVGGLYLLHEGLPPPLLAKEMIKCEFKYRDDKKISLPLFDEAPAAIGGTCNIFLKQNFFGMSAPRKETAFPIRVEMVREENEWKVASFSMNTIRGQIVLDQEQGMKLP